MSDIATFIGQVFNAAQGWLFQSVVEPLLFRYDGAGVLEQAYDGTGFFLLGVLQVAILYAVLRPLEAWIPAERWNDRRAVRVDILYTLLHRLGVFSLVLFFVLDPLFDELAGALRLEGISNFNLDDLWPGVTSIPIVAFGLYLIALDFANYWVHRAQHRFRWWWGLHSLHHSQMQMSFWADDRNHLLDDLIRDAIFALIAVVIGVQPGQFVLLVIATRSLESFQHANVRLSFGRWGERLLVSPRFHRRHHAIGDGHEGVFRGCNFAVLFPIWDGLFGTSNREAGYPATGIRDQLADGAEPGRNYGRGFWSQQWLGLKRMMRG
ncbi:MAG: sterol desaturase family protein [Burkholderiaceae bacterium]